MDKQIVSFKDLGIIDYKQGWDYQEELLRQNVELKSRAAKNQLQPVSLNELPRHPHSDIGPDSTASLLNTRHYFLLCEHPPVYTIGKSGNAKNILITEAEMTRRGIQFFQTNRGGDITFHGPQQLVGYPVLDLEKIYTDIGKYLRALEEVIILTVDEFGIRGERSHGETGVWIEPGIKGRERKLCAMGVRCSRWITMHGFALNVNTDLSYFNNIIPCGIENKQVTSIEKELGRPVDLAEVKEKVKRNFEKIFDVQLV